MRRDEILVNELGRDGARTLHVVRMGGRPDGGEWVGRLPACAGETMSVMRWVDGMDVHHLVLVWQAREVVDFRRAGVSGGVRGVLWWMGAGGVTFRGAAAEAAERYFLDFGRDGEVVCCRSAPRGAPRVGGRVAPVRLDVLGRQVEVRVVELGWAPERCVMVLGEEEARWMEG